MVAIALTSGAYSAEGKIANAQRCVNLYPEKNPDETKPGAPVTHYPRPGLKQRGAPPAPGRGRCLFGATNGDLYGVVDQTVYYISPDLQFVAIGTLLAGNANPVSIADNGVSAIVVDGSANGFQIALATRVMTQIIDANFVGATRADFIDSFLVLNKPSTNQWYSTTAGAIAFNALYVGVKTAWPDPILSIVTVEREVYIFGPKKTEVWYNAGQVPFPFQILPGNIVEQGCAARYSPAKADVNVYWLSQSPEGAFMVMKGNSQNVAIRISTSAIEDEFRKYPRVDDAIGATYTMNGHQFYKLHFPTADKTWGFDEATQQWHEDNWIDRNGVLHRARNTFCAFAYNKNWGMDWATGALYEMDLDTRTDGDGAPIVWIRSFPHVSNELKQISFARFVADVQTGESLNTGDASQFVSPFSQGFSAGFGPVTQVAAPQIALRVSRDGGNTFGRNRVKTKVSSGNYRTMMRWPQLGLARDMVFELSSTAEMVSALNGGYFDPVAAGS